MFCLDSILTSMMILFIHWNTRIPSQFFSILMVHSYLENTNKPYDITVFVQGNIIPGYKKGAIVLNVIYAGGIHLIEGC